MNENKCKINKEDNDNFITKINSLHDMATEESKKTTTIEQERQIYNEANQAAQTAIEELNKELGLNGGSRRRRASKHSKKHKKSKKSRKSRKTKSRRH
jgi:hypothetical protein